MTDYKATPEQWADTEEWAAEKLSCYSCLLELRARVEALEKRCEVQLMQLSDLQGRHHRLISDLQGRHHRLTLQVGHIEHELVRDDDDEPQQYCLEALDPPETNSKPTPNDRQVRTSLVKRVHSCIVGEPPVGHMQARSVIREVAAWLRERAGGTRASWLLDNEIKQ